MRKPKDEWYWDSRAKAYRLHAFDELFKKGRGGIRFHHYKASIVVIPQEHNVWLDEAEDFDKLIALLRRAKKACLRGPTVQNAKGRDRWRARQAKKVARHRKTARTTVRRRRKP